MRLVKPSNVSSHGNDGRSEIFLVNNKRVVMPSTEREEPKNCLVTWGRKGVEETVVEQN